MNATANKGTVSPRQNEVERDKTESLSRQRLEKIQRHLAVTLESSDTLQACLGPIACDLLELCQHLKSAIDQSLATASSERERLDQLLPAIKLQLKVVQRIEQLAKLDLRISQGNLPQNSARPPIAHLSGSEPKGEKTAI